MLYKPVCNGVGLTMPETLSTCQELSAAKNKSCHQLKHCEVNIDHHHYFERHNSHTFLSDDPFSNPITTQYYTQGINIHTTSVTQT